MRRGENIYRRKDKRWEGRYAVGKNTNGKTKYRSVYGKTLQEVREKLYPQKMKYQFLMDFQGEAAILFCEWGLHWLQEIKPAIKQSTYANYEHKLVHYVFSLIGDYNLNELNEEIAEQLLAHLKEQELQSSTIHAIFRIINQCLHSALNKELIKENPFTSIQLPKVIKKKNQSLTKQEQKRLEEAALKREEGKGIPVFLALHAGLRIGEIAALSWKDIDFENRMIHVEATYQRVSNSEDQRKTVLVYMDSKTPSATRSIPMSLMLTQLLWKRKQESTGSYVVSGKNYPSEPRLLTYHFHQIREEANLAGVNFHRLRHTFATRCLESNGDIMSVSALMGHSSTQMTLDTYAGSLMEQRIRVVEQMEKDLE
ncbi:tyrosine-type recombinase/integrase [Enterococcus sp. AZ109]|uniref:tyrosine-type recombinase/integrase n=1 Tax=Enterococcus sp. AZ109 TaxID=2774634 RepID=UPI003F268C4F